MAEIRKKYLVTCISNTSNISDSLIVFNFSYAIIFLVQEINGRTCAI